MLKSITTRTSSNHPGHVIGNLILLYQAESKIKENVTSSYKNDIEKKYECLKDIALYTKNTFISKTFIKKNPGIWQCHLERISDYLYCGEGVWWKDDPYGIEFFDGNQNPDFQPLGLTLKHFRSSSLKKIEEELKQYWEKCISENVSLPTDIVNKSDNEIEVLREEEDEEQNTGQEVVMFQKINDIGNPHFIPESTILATSDTSDSQDLPSTSEIIRTSISDITPASTTEILCSTPKSTIKKSNLTPDMIPIENHTPNLQTKEAKLLMQILEEKSCIYQLDKKKVYSKKNQTKRIMKIICIY